MIERLSFKTGDAPEILTVKRAAGARRARPRRTFRESARELPVFADTDVLVVGGGPAGCAAAIAAARTGADVMLVERYGHLGGLSTGGLVIWIDRMTDWDGRQVIEGFAVDVLDRLPKGAVTGAPRELVSRPAGVLPGPHAWIRGRVGHANRAADWRSA